MARNGTTTAGISKPGPSPAPVEIGRRFMIDPPALAVMRSAAREALGDRRAPQELVNAVLSTLEFVATLPAGSQAYRPNLYNRARVGTYVRAKYGAKRRFSGSIFLDERLDIVAEGTFEARETPAVEGGRLLKAPRWGSRHSEHTSRNAIRRLRRQTPLPMRSPAEWIASPGGASSGARHWPPRRRRRSRRRFSWARGAHGSSRSAVSTRQACFLISFQWG